VGEEVKRGGGKVKEDVKRRMWMAAGKLGKGVVGGKGGRGWSKKSKVHGRGRKGGGNVGGEGGRGEKGEVE